MHWNTYFIVLFEHHPNFAQKGPQKQDHSFSLLQTHRLINQTFCCNPPLYQKCVFLSCLSWNQKHSCWTKKHNLKSGKTKIRKGIWKEKQDRKPKYKIDEKHCNWFFDVVLFMKEKQRKPKKKTRNQKKAKKKDKKEKKNKRERERQRKKHWKGGGQKRLRKNKGGDSKINKKCLLGGKTGLFSIKSQERKAPKKNKTKKATIRRV